MSFYLRKTVKVGPLRLNLSKSGLGVSAGLPGLRVGVVPRGSYVRIAPRGISYQATGRAGGRATARHQLNNDPNIPYPSSNTEYLPGEAVLSDVTGATATALTSSQPSELVTQLNDAANARRILPWVLAITILFSVAISPFLLLPGALAVTWAWWRDGIRRTVAVFYEVDGPLQARYQALVDAFAEVCRAEKAWHVVAQGDVRTTYQQKVNGGATSIVRRDPLRRGLGGSPHLSSNIAVPALRSAERSVYLLPDRVLVQDRNTYAEVSYENLDISSSNERFIEDGFVPSDASVVGRTWRYVNVKGGPDQRYRDNRQLPVLQYGKLTFQTGTGMKIMWSFSRVTATFAVAEALTAMRKDPVLATHPVSRPACPPESADVPRYSPIGLPLVPLSEDGRLPIVGESLCQEALKIIAGGQAFGQELDRHHPVTAVLVPEPENVHDRNAVRVDVLLGAQSIQVGYLASENARAYQPPLLLLRAAGSLGTCSGRITGGGPRSYGMYLHIASPDTMVIANATAVPPSGYATDGVSDPPINDRATVHLGGDRSCVVTGEGRHQDILGRYAPRRAADLNRVTVSLEYCTIGSGRYRGERALEVRLDGRRVGELTPAMTRRYAPLIDAAHGQGAVVTCEAFVMNSPRGLRMELKMPRDSGHHR